MATRVSCGVLIFNEARELLLCRLTGTPYWDIPKGLDEPGESALDTALREVHEECGLRLAGPTLHDLGRFDYRPGKDLHLFATVTAPVPATALRCTSVFRDRHGRTRPEADRFAWTPVGRLPTLCAPRLTHVLTQRLDLPGVFAAAAALAAR